MSKTESGPPIKSPGTPTTSFVWLESPQSPRKRLVAKSLVFLIGLVCCLELFKRFRPRELHAQPLWVHDVRDQLSRQNTTVVALVFYGRRQTVSILNSYLEQNARRNGGMLDEVQLLVRTDNRLDLEYLDIMLARNPEYYKRIDINAGGWTDQYSTLERDVLYVKIDDDIVYIGEHAIERLVEAKMKHPVGIHSANVINHSVLSWVHAHRGALYPFTNTSVSAKLANADGYDWRVTSITGLEDNESEKIPVIERELQEQVEEEHLVSSPQLIDGDLSATRFGGAGYSAWDGCTLGSWDCAAISHYSFFANLEQGTTSRYDFGTWDLHATGCDRWSINFFIFYGWEIMDHMETLRETGDDEPFVSQHICWATGHHSLAVGGALASHFSYGPQIIGMRQTDILPRYRSLAIEELGYVID